MKHSDQIVREKIPSRTDLPTAYHPLHDLLMVIPIPDINKVGSIILPDRATIVLNEGHVIEKGPRCGDQIGVGDCITWDSNSEYRMNVDGTPFILVRESCVTMYISRKELVHDDPAQGKLPLTEGEPKIEPCPGCGVEPGMRHMEYCDESGQYQP